MTEHNASGGSLAGRVFRGSAWLFASYGLYKLGRMIVMLVIAALLSPEAYGVVSLCSVVIFVGEIGTEFGIWQAVIHRKEPDEHFLNTAFTANVLGGAVVAIGLFLIAPWIALFYREPEITNLLRLMALGLLADAAYFVPDGLLRKQLKFKLRSLPEFGCGFAAVFTTVTLLFLGVGILSFAVGYVVEKVVRCSLVMVITRWQPRFRIHWTSFKEIVSYAKHIWGAEVAKVVSSNIDFLIVGRILGAEPLGIYTLAFNLANYPVTNFAVILSRIAFPTFAILQENPERAQHAYLKILQIVAGLVLPLLVMLAVLADPLIVGLLGEKWQPAVLPVQAMVVSGISRAISIPGSDILRASGSPNLPFRINVAESVVLAGALVLVTGWGIEAVALTVVVVLSISSWTITLVACRKFRIGLLELVRAFLPGIALAASGAAAIFSLRLLGLSTLPDALQLTLSIAAAGAGMLFCLATALRSFLHQIVALATSRNPK